MKHLYFLATILIFFITGCQTLIPHTLTNIPKNPLMKTLHLTNLSIVPKVGGGTGGNPEVELNKCLNKTEKERNLCINIFYPEEINIGIFPSNGTRIKLAGRSSLIERKELIVKNQEKIILSIDTSKISLPIKVNIKSAKKLQYKNNLAIIINTKDINNTLIIEDKEGKVLLEYLIIK